MKVKELKQILKQLDGNDVVAIQMWTKADIERLMETSMTHLVWQNAVKVFESNSEPAEAQLRQTCWDAEYDFDIEDGMQVQEDRLTDLSDTASDTQSAGGDAQPEKKSKAKAK